MKYKVALWGYQEGGNRLCGWTVIGNLDHPKGRNSPVSQKNSSPFFYSLPLPEASPLLLKSVTKPLNQEIEMSENCGVCSVIRKSSSKPACLFWPVLWFSVADEVSSVCGKCRERIACSLGYRPWQGWDKRKALAAQRWEMYWKLH